MSDTRQEIHALIDQLDAGQLAAVGQLLEVIVHDEGGLTEEDRRIIAASREYFRKGGAGVAFEQVVADCGFSIDEIRGSKSE